MSSLRPFTPASQSKQRGLYSDISQHPNRESTKHAITKPNTRSLLQRANAAVGVTKFKPKSEFKPKRPTSDRQGVARRAFDPKVQKAYVVQAEEVPRKIEVERRKRSFAAKDIASLLAARGLSEPSLLPVSPLPAQPTPSTSSASAPSHSKPTFQLALQLFDDTDFDDRNPEEWLDSGVHEDTDTTPSVPAKTLAFVDDKELAWVSCTVEAYDSEAFEYTVRLASSTDDTEDTATSSSSSSTATTTTTRPRILVLFAAEDPEVFADRVLAAYNLRRDTENRLRYAVTVDCMPISEQVSMKDLDEDIERHLSKAVGSTMSTFPRVFASVCPQFVHSPVW